MADDNDMFAQAASREKRLFEQLASAPVSEVLGVVGPKGASGWKSRGEDLWTQSFTFEAWQIEEARLQTKPLTVQKKATDEELAQFRELIEPYTVVRIKARILTDSAYPNPQALLVAFVGIDRSNAELNQHAEQLQTPVRLEDPIFGTLTLDRRLDWFTADVVWDGKPVSLNLLQSSKVEDALKTARALWESQSVWNQRIRDYAVQELLPLKNDSWLDEDEAELTSGEFKDRMTLEAITVNPDGSFDFWHNDGDLFCGHSIMVSGSLTEGPTNADIPG